MFAALGFGIYFLYEKFLAVDNSQTSLDFSSPSPSPSPASESAPKKGQAVDIVIQDEELPVDDNTGQYYVGSNRFMLTSGDVSGGASSQASKPVQHAQPIPVATAGSQPEATAPMPSEPESSPGESTSEQQFVPVRNLETLYNASGKEAVTKNDAPAEEPASPRPAVSDTDEQSFSAADEQLDTLPDMEGMGVFDSESSSSGYGDADINNESDFATGGVRRNAEPPEVKDAELMAKAISTILTNEE